MIAKAPETNLRVAVFDSELGWMALVESPHGVSRLTFAHASPKAALEELGLRGLGFVSDSLKHVSSSGPLVRRLQAFAQGGFDDFLDVPVDAGRQTTFQRRVRAACRSIPPGSTCSYGELAAAVGAPRAARAVGSVMAANRVAILIPCHRVLRSGGRLGGYSMGPGLPLKRRLLDLERRMQAMAEPGRFDANHAAALCCGAIGTSG